MPKTIKNVYGHEEETLTYIMGHTQLLPRHVINIFNKIAMISFSGAHEITISKRKRSGAAFACRKAPSAPAS